MKKIIISMFIIMLLFLSFSAEAKVVKFSSNLKILKIKNPVYKTVSFASSVGDYGEKSSVCKELQAKKTERNTRMHFWKTKIRYIPDDCDSSYWSRHHIAHYCDNPDIVR